MVTWWMSACLCALFLISTCSSQCNKTVSVEVTSSGRLTLPLVDGVILWTDNSVQSWNFPNGSRRDGQYIFVRAEDSYYLLTVRDATYNVTLEFNAGAISCKNITLDLQVSSRSFSCVPVSSCNNNDDIAVTRIRWLKAYYIDDDSDVDDYQELGSNGCDGFIPVGISNNIIGEDRISFNDSRREDNSIIFNGTLSIMQENACSAGYYIAVADGTIIYQFTFYYGPEFYNTPSEESAKVTLGADFHEFSCLFRSFPSTIVTWYLNDEAVNQPNVRYANLSSNNNMMPNTTVTSVTYDYTWTLFGGLTINDVQYENGGTYRCSGSNGYMTAESSRLLRVRSPLRPLWPILGIIASCIITAVFIAAGYIVDKIRGDDKMTISQDEIDGAFRPSSVNSFNEDDTKELYRRSSSAKELLPNQTS